MRLYYFFLACYPFFSTKSRVVHCKYCGLWTNNIGCILQFPSKVGCTLCLKPLLRSHLAQVHFYDLPSHNSSVCPSWYLQQRGHIIVNTVDSPLHHPNTIASSVRLIFQTKWYKKFFHPHNYLYFPIFFM